jgi:hypothetical protein
MAAATEIASYFACSIAVVYHARSASRVNFQASTYQAGSELVIYYCGVGK